MAEACDACGEVFYPAASLEAIQAEAKKRGLFGLGAKTTVGTSGSALDVKLPKSLVRFLKLQKGQAVTIEPIDKDKFQVIVER